jgi:hypothetical protein
MHKIAFLKFVSLLLKYGIRIKGLKTFVIFQQNGATTLAMVVHVRVTELH